MYDQKSQIVLLQDETSVWPQVLIVAIVIVTIIIILAPEFFTNLYNSIFGDTDANASVTNPISSIEIIKRDTVNKCRPDENISFRGEIRLYDANGLLLPHSAVSTVREIHNRNYDNPNLKEPGLNEHIIRISLVTPTVIPKIVIHNQGYCGGTNFLDGADFFLKNETGSVIKHQILTNEPVQTIAW